VSILSKICPIYDTRYIRGLTFSIIKEHYTIGLEPSDLLTSKQACKEVPTYLLAKNAAENLLVGLQSWQLA